MSEILRTAIDIAPYAVTAVGSGAAGAYVDHLMSRRIEEERQPVSEVMADVNDSLPEVPRIRQLGRYAISTLALTATFAGAANAYAWFGGGSPNQSEPRIGLVADRSGATAFGSEPTAAELVSGIAKDFADEGDAEVTAFVGKGGQTLPTEASEVPSIEPFGDAPMREAVSTAIANARISIQEQAQSEDEQTTAIVVATNGNTFGSPSDVAEKAEEINAPVYVVDVAEGTDAKAIAQFRRAARRTGGEYWDAEDAEGENISQLVAEDLAPAEGEAQEEEDSKWPQRLVIGALSILALWRTGRDKRNMPLTFSGSKVSR